MAFFSLFLFQMAKAETAEKDIFFCKSSVPGFETFTITQLIQVEGEQTKIGYQLKAGLIGEDVWNQYGDVAPVTGDGNPVFQSEFTKTIVTPVTPPEPPAVPSPIPVPPPSQPVEEDVFVNVSINLIGTGSLSVDADLAPIDCQRNF
jgi:hypothetical protein